MEKRFFTDISFQGLKVVNIKQKKKLKISPRTKKGLESRPFQNFLLFGFSLDRLALGWRPSWQNKL